MSKKVIFEDEIIGHIKEQEEVIQKQREEIKKLEKELANLRRLTGVSSEVQQCAITGLKYINKLKTPATYEMIPVQQEGHIKRQTNADDW
jgi:hypothetical protein